jgi:multidrug efflux pump
MMGLYAALIAGAVLIGVIVPPGFMPQLDKDYLVSFAQLPNGATLDRSEDVMRQMVRIAKKQPGVKASVGFPGLSIYGFTNSSSADVLFIILAPSADRRSKESSAKAIADSLRQKFAAIKGSNIEVFPPPPVLGLGTLGGFKMHLEDRGALGYTALNDAMQAFLKRAAQTPELGPTFSSYQINNPQLNVDLDRVKAKQLGVSVEDVFNTMQIYLGSLYVNDFNLFGRGIPGASPGGRAVSRVEQ